MNASMKICVYEVSFRTRALYISFARARTRVNS